MIYEHHVILRGIIEQAPKPDMQAGEQGVYRLTLGVKRGSGNLDHLPVMMTEALLKELPSAELGAEIAIAGELRTRPVYDEANVKHKDLYVWATRRYEVAGKTGNQVILCGSVRDAARYQETPGGYKITELEVEVHHRDKVHHIPLVIWSGAAKAARWLERGDEVQTVGRLQSRIYTKRLPDGRIAEKTTIEVSCWRIAMPEKRIRKNTNEEAGR